MTEPQHSTGLTTTEAARLDELEAVVERGQRTFIEVGEALRQIRDERLYRASHGTFELYIKDRWQMSRPSAYRLISSAQVVAGLSSTEDIPERAVRPLVRVAPERRQAVVAQARALAGDKPVTSRHVEMAVAEIVPTDAGPTDADLTPRERLLHTVTGALIQYMSDTTAGTVPGPTNRRRMAQEIEGILGCFKDGRLEPRR
jgi:hypothetical protein